ncbi:hypothetical protein BRM1_00075 [Brevibacterium sp. BRM-1]|uniref:hypothetical protein n=1 Tax=Brevibacterium sp. BRM-1 TaxID=2999062 RepID=UPI00227EBACC|nr:hypothetical protein [Brevibacterium sp. BRM-1]WAL40312.1 hypothetical protein BRM1_00075 [Brevibacterium sp. BRM-1]
MSALSSTRRFPALRLAAASTMLVALLAAGCGGPEQTAGLATPPASGESSATPSPTLPPYTTTLTLTAEQKTAAEDALAALERYFAVTSDVYGSGGHDSQKFNDVATGQALDSAQRDVKSMKDDHTRADGKMEVEKRDLKKLLLSNNQAEAEFTACIALSGLILKPVRQTDSSQIQASTKHGTLKFSLIRSAETWKVKKQDLVEYSCKSA